MSNSENGTEEVIRLSKFYVGDDDMEFDIMLKIIIKNMLDSDDYKPSLIMSKRLETTALALSLQRVVSEMDIEKSLVKGLVNKISLFGAEHDHQKNLFFHTECNDFLDFCAGVEGKYEYILVDNLENYCFNLANDEDQAETYRVANFLSNATGNAQGLMGLKLMEDSDFSFFGKGFELDFVYQNSED